MRFHLDVDVVAKFFVRIIICQKTTTVPGITTMIISPTAGFVRTVGMS